jgi:hypothetical protein
MLDILSPQIFLHSCSQTRDPGSMQIFFQKPDSLIYPKMAFKNSEDFRTSKLTDLEGRLIYKKVDNVKVLFFNY